MGDGNILELDINDDDAQIYKYTELKYIKTPLNYTLRIKKKDWSEFRDNFRSVFARIYIMVSVT